MMDFEHFDSLQQMQERENERCLMALCHVSFECHVVVSVSTPF